ncbi:MAG: peptide chain release factor N(5)-glutamine methyltransferase [Rickettsiales endosymbiont of Dermacentor nuttalli]
MNNICTVKSALLYGRNELFNAKIESYNLDARLLVAHVLNLSIEKLIISLENVIDQKQWLCYQQLIARRAKFEPIAHLRELKEFFSLEFKVNHNTLIPRPDSETLIETVLQYLPNKNAELNILDLGTGTGCLLLTLLTLYTNATGLGVDISAQALKIACANSIKLDLKNRTFFVQSNWISALSQIKTYDIIVSNPPYINHHDLQILDHEVKDYEPNLALDGGPDGLDCYRVIAETIGGVLTKTGKIFVEIGYGQKEDIKKIFQNHNMNCISEHKDLNQIVRCLVFEKNH